jgi:GNAT superfamily N-acetyltransferase
VPPPTLIRRASPSEAEALSALAVRSKAHWGYDDTFLHAVRSDLELTATQVEKWMVFALTEDGEPRGFYALRPTEGGAVELERLFVDPAALGRSYGRQLFGHAVEAAGDGGFTRIDIASDPYAERFYLRLGAIRVGEAASPVAGRTLPLLRFDVKPK